MLSILLSTCRHIQSDRHVDRQHNSQADNSSRRRSPARDYRQESTPYGDRYSKDPPRGYNRSRREDDDRDHYTRTDREPKRRRSDPMGDEKMNGFHAERDERNYRCTLVHGSRYLHTCSSQGSLIQECSYVCALYSFLKTTAHRITPSEQCRSSNRLARDMFDSASRTSCHTCRHKACQTRTSTKCYRGCKS